jgi:hypothetical protein
LFPESYGDLAGRGRTATENGVLSMVWRGDRAWKRSKRIGA